jgi:hypothetical protein
MLGASQPLKCTVGGDDALAEWVWRKRLAKPRKNGGRDRDRTCDPYHVKVVLFR